MTAESRQDRLRPVSRLCCIEMFASAKESRNMMTLKLRVCKKTMNDTYLHDNRPFLCTTPYSITHNCTCHYIDPQININQLITIYQGVHLKTR